MGTVLIVIVRYSTQDRLDILKAPTKKHIHYFVIDFYQEDRTSNENQDYLSFPCKYICSIKLFITYTILN